MSPLIYHRFELKSCFSRSWNVTAVTGPRMQQEVVPVSDVPAFASIREALGVLRTVMGYLSARLMRPRSRPRRRPSACWRWRRWTRSATATRAKVLGAFTAAQEYSADGDYSPGRG